MRLIDLLRSVSPLASTLTTVLAMLSVVLDGTPAVLCRVAAFVVFGVGIAVAARRDRTEENRS